MLQNIFVISDPLGLLQNIVALMALVSLYSWFFYSTAIIIKKIRNKDQQVRGTLTKVASISLILTIIFTVFGLFIWTQEGCFEKPTFTLIQNMKLVKVLILKASRIVAPVLMILSILASIITIPKKFSEFKYVRNRIIVLTIIFTLVIFFGRFHRIEGLCVSQFWY